MDETDKIETRVARKRAGFIYVIQGDCYVKIGVSYQHPKRGRIWEINSPFALTVLIAKRVHRPYKVERMLHNKYDEFRCRGEWFQLPDEKRIELVAEIKGMLGYCERRKIVQKVFQSELWKHFRHETNFAKLVRDYHSSSGVFSKDSLSAVK